MSTAYENILWEKKKNIKEKPPLGIARITKQVIYLDKLACSFFGATTGLIYVCIGADNNNIFIKEAKNQPPELATFQVRNTGNREVRVYCKKILYKFALAGDSKNPFITHFKISDNMIIIKIAD